MHLSKFKFALLQFLSSQSVITWNWLLKNVVHGAAQLSSFNFLTELLPEYFVYRTRKNLSAQRRQSHSLFCSFLAHSFWTNLLSRLSFLSPKENIEECHSQYHGLWHWAIWKATLLQSECAHHMQAPVDDMSSWYISPVVSMVEGSLPVTNVEICFGPPHPSHKTLQLLPSLVLLYLGMWC